MPESSTDHDTPTELSSSPDKTLESVRSPRERSPAASLKLGRSSSIRFSQDTNTATRSSMASRRAGVSSSDEITPIRHAERSDARNYNTSQSVQSNSSTGESTSRSPQTSKATNSARVTGDEDIDHEAPWYKRLVERYGSVTLDNKGSVARDHLALERTFLAWLRTSLAFASIGIAITQLFRLNTSLGSRSNTVSQVATSYTTLPLSPLLGHSVPVELLPYLQQVTGSPHSSTLIPELGPTLLDQLLLLPPIGSEIPTNQPDLSSLYGSATAGDIPHIGRPLGATFIGISIVVLLVGFHRYFESQYWIIRGKFPASRGSIALVGLIAGALIIASLVVVVVVAPTQHRK